MLPIEWKKEIQESYDEAQHRSDENRKSEQDKQNALITTPLYSLRNHLKAYIKKQDRYEKGKRCREITMIIGLFITAAFTLGLATVGAFQTFAFVESERAFLSITGANFLSTGNQFPLIVVVDLTNSGKSVATGEIRFYSREKSLPAVPEYNNPTTISYAPVVAGGTNKPSISADLPPNDIAKIQDGTIPFFIYGVIDFSDVFTFFGPRHIGFCLRHYPRGNPLISIFDTCPETAYTYAR